MKIPLLFHTGDRIFQELKEVPLAIICYTFRTGSYYTVSREDEGSSSLDCIVFFFYFAALLFSMQLRGTQWLSGIYANIYS